MFKFGVLCPSAIGHLNPMCVLASELKRRGHEVVFFCPPDGARMLADAGIKSLVIAERQFPEGSLKRFQQDVGSLNGLAAVRRIVDWSVSETKANFLEAPTAIQSLEINALLVDQASRAGGTIAEHCGIPFVTICDALPLNREDSVPPFNTSWAYRDSWLPRLRNRIANRLVQRVLQPVLQTTNKQREAWKLRPYSSGDEYDSPLATICQIPTEFDFPRKERRFHYVGPLQEPSRREPLSLAAAPFPFERLTGKPLIYASLGTLQNQIFNVFQTIAAACCELDVQLVISLGNSTAIPADSAFPGSPIVVGYAPQQLLIDKAALVITHAGLNTVMGALSSGVPVVGIPITSEQPGIAARLKRTGAGEVLPVSRLTVARLRALVTEVLKADSYRQHARGMQEAIRKAGGVSRAADIVLQALRSGSPDHAHA